MSLWPSSLFSMHPRYQFAISKEGLKALYASYYIKALTLPHY